MIREKDVIRLLVVHEFSLKFSSCDVCRHHSGTRMKEIHPLHIFPKGYWFHSLISSLRCWPDWWSLHTFSLLECEVPPTPSSFTVTWTRMIAIGYLDPWFCKGRCLDALFFHLALSLYRNSARKVSGASSWLVLIIKCLDIVYHMIIMCVNCHELAWVVILFMSWELPSPPSACWAQGRHWAREPSLGGAYAEPSLGMK